MTPKLVLTYFDIDGGRGEAARLAMHIGGVEWQDRRISFEEFGRTRDSFPLGRVPRILFKIECLRRQNSSIGNGRQFCKAADCPEIST